MQLGYFVMSINKSNSTPASKEIVPEILAEYNALRTDVMQRMEIRHQMVSLALITAGTLFTFGLQKDAPTSILFVYPILACFITGIWAHNVIFTKKIVFYIRDNIESKLHGIKWETSSEKERFSLSSLSGVISTSGVFLTTQIIAVVLGFLKSTFTTIDVFLIWADGVALLITILMVFSTMRRESTAKR